MRGNEAINIGGRQIGSGRPALVTAEIGGNHGGDPELAGIMVRAAAAAGAGAVKFQAYGAPRFLSRQSPYYEDLAAEELSFEDLAALVALARKLGLAAGLTVFDAEGLALARAAGADFLKISSGDLTYHQLLSQAARAGLPLFVSTGAGTADEVAAAREVLAPAAGRLVLLQCASLYPAPPEAASLAVLAGWLASGWPAGYSDHTLGLSAARAALVLGAMVLEKHFTTDRNLPGGDNAISAGPGEFRRLAEFNEQLGTLRGGPLKRPHPQEEPARPLLRRALLAARNLPAGTPLTGPDLALKRPADPAAALLGPERLASVLGRVLKRPLAADAPVTEADLADA